jgi:hypothetical protein
MITTTIVTANSTNLFVTITRGAQRDTESDIAPLDVPLAPFYLPLFLS